MGTPREFVRARHGVPLPVEMKYNPKKHHRRSVRLKGHDYASAGWYYITICTHEREFLFGEIVQSQMRPSRTGVIAHKCWNEIPRHFPRAAMDVSIVMPNHLHGIIVIAGGTPWRAPMAAHKEAFGKADPGSLATIVRLFKQAVTIQAGTDVGARHGVPLQQKGALAGPRKLMPSTSG